MKLSTDPDILRIPAFMRKRSIKSRAKKPLLLTALDRKKAGVTAVSLRALRSPKPKVSVNRKRSNPVRLSPSLSRFLRPRRTSGPHNDIEFAPPLLDFSEPEIIKTPPHKQKPIGVITNYYNKIHVAVIKLRGTLAIGDSIAYDTDDGPYEEIVKSMEIDRCPVFKAGPWKEVGIKMKKIPRVGCMVYKK